MANYDVDPEKRFEQAIRRAITATGDLRVPLTLISKDFYKSQTAIFQLQGQGQYEDLSEGYKKEKREAVGFVYPILRRTGRLEASITKPNAPGSVNFIGRKQLKLGTSVPYAEDLQEGLPGVMPARPFFFIGPEAPRFAKGDLDGRPERWLNTINDYAIKVTQREIQE